MRMDELKDAAAFGGGFAAVFAAVRWLANWIASRIDKRQAQLDAEHASLDVGWKEYRQLIERRLQSIEKQNRALSAAFQHVSAALIRIDPQNEALITAERLMAAAFPTDFTMAAQMAGAAIDVQGSAA